VRRLPILYVCENNLYGASTPYTMTSMLADVAERAAAYGVSAQIVDGMDVLAVHAATGKALERIRAGDGPILLECKTYRFTGHSRSDARGYRTREEEAEWKSRDPISRLGGALVAAGRVDAGALEHVAAEVEAELDVAVEFARNSPDPTLEQALEDVYA
jgi:TPP-dependent pyruvate/acetoin dehydrogenase alpha subunit